MKSKIALLICVIALAALSCATPSLAQTNHALTGTPNHTGGGAGLPPGGFGPLNWNDGVIAGGPSCLSSNQPWGWVTTGGDITYTWGSPVTFNKIVFYKSNRPMTSCTAQYWNGSSFVTFATYSGTTCTEDSISFAPVTTTILRLQNVTGSSNPNFREIQVWSLPPANVAPTFAGGSPQSLTVCGNTTGNSINSLMAINDADVGQIETYSVTASPSNGTLSGVAAYTVTSTGSTITPTGMSYTPNPSFSGSDAFTVQVADGNGGTVSTTVNVTVNPGPTTISGASTVCAGSTTTLTNGTIGGVWTSSNPAIASVGSSSGVVTGVTSGAITITYTIGSCTATKPMVINCAPTFTGGNPQYLTVCQSSGGNSINSLLQVTDADAGQTLTWTLTVTPSNGTVTVGGTQTSTGGTVTPTGYSYTPLTGFTGADAFTIQVSDGAGGIASTTIIVTVNPAPTAITGTTTICRGTTSTLSSTPSGGAWTSGNPAVASVGGGTGIVTGVSSGTAVITYTAGGCPVTTTVTVIAAPVISSLSSEIAIPGTSITISGNDFNASTTNNIVWFGAARGTVTSASTTSLSVTVPTGGNFDFVAIENTACGLTKRSLPSFLPTYNNAAYVAGTFNFATRVNFSSSTGPNHVNTTDIDGDGMPDAVVVDFSSVTVNVYRNTSTSGSVSFSGSAVTLSVPPNIGYPGVGDVDGDGKADIILTSSGSGFVTVFRNTSTVGSISFAAGVTFSAPGAGNIASLADFDGDGKMDIYTANQGNDVVSVLRNTGSVGSLSFAANVNFSTGAGSTPTYAIAGDIDGDGKVELLSADRGGNKVSVFRNTSSIGSISFAARVDLTTGVFTNNVVLLDADGDGLLDIGALSNNSAFFSIFPNTSTPGTISTGARLDFATGTNPNQLGVADFDGDGRPDVSVVNVSSNTIGVYRNLSTVGSISMGTPVNFPTSNSPLGLWVGDIDGDGKADMSFVNGGLNTFSVYRNNPLQPITGTPIVCPGTTTTLADATTGGTWSSSNPAIATVGSSTGIVTGVATGTVTITYAGTAGPSFTGNIAIVTVTVDPLPAAIGGPNSVCTGATITLTDATSGGVWSSSAVGLATVGSGTGVVTGVATGVPTISYTTSNGCYVTKPVTVNQSPTGISGTFSVCVGLTTTLSNGFSGGVWTSSATGIASVGSSSGVVTGVSGGTATITYTMPGNCFATQVVTVNTNPAAITGPSAVCVGGNVTLANATSGGLFSSSATGLATVGGGTGMVTGISAGTLTMSYVLSTGCYATMPFTVNALPAAIPTGVTTSFSFTGAMQNYTVPAGVSIISVQTNGARGGNNGGNGAMIQSDNIVSGGQVLKVLVGGMGASGGLGGTVNANGYGSGGGGGSFVTTSTNIPLVIAGGGGGASVWNCAGQGGLLTNGGGSLGTAGEPLSTNGNGGVTGVDQGNGCGGPGHGGGGLNTNGGGPSPSDGKSLVNGGAGGTTQGADNCISSFFPGFGIAAGGFGGGGAGGNGGGGGGGYSGGAGGTNGSAYPCGTSGQAPGGGGGSFNGGFNQVNVANSNSGNGNVTISYSLTRVCVGSTIPLTNATPGGTWTSSNTGIATVGSATGMVTGVSAGVATITYTLSTGCFTTSTITVNPLPATIAGTPAVCIGLTTTLTDATGTGFWSSSNTTLATIGSVTGVVTGVAAGTPIISYILPTGCLATQAVTVNPLPAAIGGTLTACPGTTTTLTNASGGGSWSSSNTAVATVGSGTGIVTGVSAGTSTITYTLPTGCIMTANVTINPLPAAITGSPIVCIGTSSTLASGTGGGTWTSSNPAQGSIVSTTGVLTGVATGNPVITYTLPTGCITTVVATVNPNPAVIGGASSVCVGLTTLLTNGSGSSTWSSSNTAIATVGSGTGVVTGVSAGALTITFMLPTGCIATKAFTVNPTPAAITGTPHVCVGATRTLANGSTGGTWSSSNPAIGSIGSTTGIVSGLTVGTITITYTLPAGCFAVQAFTVNTTPVPNTGTATVCVGSTTTLSNGTGGGSWMSSNVVLATVGSSTGIVTGNVPGNPVISYVLPAGGCSASTVVTVNPTPGTSAGSNNVCVGSTTTLSNGMMGGTWSSSASGIASVGSSTGIVSGVTAGTANITYTLPTGCFSVKPMTVNPTPPAITGLATVCTGQTTSLTNGTPGGSWTSSNTAFATVSGTGVVTGVATGVVTITYTINPGSCFVTHTMTVNQTPTAIAGSSNLCIGVPTPLTNGIGGGVWVSSNTGLATIGSSTGIATGVALGNPVITYTLPGGCFATLLTTVNNQPAAITGTPVVCVGLTTTLANTSLGGTWTSSNGSLASVGSTTGVVTGVSAGVPTISYTLPGGCSSTQPVTVNPTPAAITGTAVVCVTFTTNLTDATSGGVWSSSNPAQATVGSTTGVVTGVSAGNPSIIYTLPAGCTASVVLTVNALPNMFSVTGGGAYCAGGPGLAVGLSGSTSGTTYQLYRGTTPVGSPVSGTGTPFNFGVFTTAGTYTVIATVTATGCSVTMSGSTTISINPLPTIYNATGGGAYCSGGSGLHIYLSGSEPFGINYQLYNGGTPVGSPIAGLGTMLDFGLQTAAGTYTILATNTTTTCTVNMLGSPTITINPLPNVFPVTGGGSFCAGGIGVNVGLGSSNTGINYQLYNSGIPVGSPLPGTGSSLNFGLQTAGGTYTVVGTNSLTGCVNSMSGSAIVTVNPLPTVFSVTGGGGYCAGGLGVHIFLSGSTVGVNYQLWMGGFPFGSSIPGTGGTLDFGFVTTAGTYTVVATDGSTFCTNNMSGSAIVTIDPLPTVFNVTGGGAYCAGGAGVPVGLNNSTIGVSYQLFDGATPVGGPISGTGGALSFGMFTTATTYTVVATNTATTCVNNMAGSATVTINPLPNPYTITGGGGYCVGGTGVTIDLSGSDGGINYQLYNGISTVGAVMPGTGTTLAFGMHTAAGTYTIRATDPITSCTSVMTGSVVVTVNPLPVAYTVTGGGNYCSGGTGVAVGLSNSTVGVNYQLYNAGSPVGGLVGGTGAAITFGPQTLSGSYTVIATNATTFCVNNMLGSVNVNIDPLPVVYTVTGGGSYCLGGAGVHVGLANSNIGVNYQLYDGATSIGGPLAGINAPLDFGLITAVGTYTVTATDVATTCMENMTGSATVSINSLPVVYNVTGGGSYCSGGAGVNVAIDNSDPAVNYQLFLGSTPVGAPLAGVSGVLSFGLQTGAGNYTVVGTDALTGCMSTMSGFAVVAIDPLPNSYVMTGGGSYCSGGTGVVVGLSGSQTGMVYQLYNGGPVGAPIPGTGLAISFGLQTAAGTYTVVATDDFTLCTNNMTGGAVVTINSLPAPFPVSGGGNYCTGGGGVHVFLGGSVIGVNYQLYLGTSPVGTSMPGTGGVLDFGAQTSAGVYTVSATDASTLCTANMTGSATIAIDPLPTVYAVTGGGSYCPGGTGVSVGLFNSDAGTDYQLLLDGVPVGPVMGGTGLALDFGVQAGLGNYTVMATNTVTGCTGNMGGSVNVSLYPLPAVHTVAGGGNYCSGGTGVPVTLSGSNIGITYQLYNAGLPMGASVPGSGTALNFGLQTTAGSYLVIATNAITGCADTMHDSAVVVIDPLPLDQPLTGGGSYCIGGTGLNISLTGSELGVSYQLFNGTTAVSTAIMGTGAPLNFGIFTMPGTYTVVATNVVTLCTMNLTGSVVISIDPLPLTYFVTGGGSYCNGGTGMNIGLSSSQSGVDYQLFLGATPLGIVPGTGSAITFGLQTTVGTYTVKATNTTTGCVNNMTGSATITVNPLPVRYTMTGGGGYCTGGTGVSVGLSGSNIGITYQLYNGGTSVGTGVAGTGAPLAFGLQTASGSYTVVATNNATGCVDTMNGSVAVVINALPSVFMVSGSATSYCAGGAGIIVYLSGSQTGVSYQLYRGGTTPVGASIAGTGTALDFGPQTIAGTYTVVASNTTTMCTNNMGGMATVVINPLPAVFPVVGGGSYCPGGAGVNVSLGGSNTGIKYQLFRGGGTPVGAPVNGTGLTVNFGPQTIAGVYTVVATNIVTGCTNAMVGSATVAVNAVPVTQTVTGGGSYCTGGTGVTIGLSSSVTGTNYQLIYAGATPIGAPVAGTGLPLSFGLHTIAGTYTVSAIDAVTGCTAAMTGSATVAINALPTVYSVTGGGNFCPGAPGVSIGLSGSSTGISYQLYNGTTATGAPVMGTGSPISFGTFTATGIYTVVASNGATFCTRTMAGTATVGHHATPTTFTVIGGGSYCAGGAGVNISLSGSTSGISYQLLNGGMPEGSPVIGTGMPLSFGMITSAGTTYTILATNGTTGCTAAMSGSVSVSINPVVVPSTAITSTYGDTICEGTMTTFSAATVNGGLSPAYQWTVNGAPVFSGSSYSYIPLNGDVVGVAVTSSATCAIPATVSDNTTMTVLPNLMPSVNIAALPGVIVCQGSIVNFIATPTNGGSAPVYQWKRNGLNVGSSSTFSYIPADGDEIYCLLNSSYVCRLMNSVSSAHVIMEVDTPITPVVGITVSPGLNVSAGLAVTFTANLGNSVPYPTYQWLVNGVAIGGAIMPSFTTATLSNLDIVTCEVTSGGGCPGVTGAGSVTMHVYGVGVSQVSANGSDIVLIPNPNKGTFTIKGSLGITSDEEVAIEVTNMLGQEVYSAKVQTRNGELNEKIQLNSSLANGMYVLSLRSAGGTKVFHVVVEQ